MMRHRRKDKTRKLRKRVLILCEGSRTEPNYFNGIKYSQRVKKLLSAVDIEVYQPNNYSPVGLVTEAIFKKNKAFKQNNPYDEVWIVFDKDFHYSVDQVFEKAKKNKIKIAYSSICFEYWFLLHYEKIDREFDKCNKVIKYIQQKYNPDYHKNAKIFQILESRTPIALENAAWLRKKQKKQVGVEKNIFDRNPYTNVDELVTSLLVDV